MRTVKVTRESYETCSELAKLAKVPEVKLNLQRLAAAYRRALDELEEIESEPLALDRAPDLRSRQSNTIESD
jgi:hypothetical protein